MKRKVSILLVSLVLLVGIGVAVGNDPPAYLYPDLPFSTVTKHTVVSLLKESDHHLKKLATEHDHVWYGTKVPQDQAAAKLTSALQAQGWTFVAQEGSGYFYSNGSEKIVITSQMWSSKFVLFKVPVGNHLLSVGIRSSDDG